MESVQAGSGAAFSLLPPENAVGNFVKVVQRVPVKIVFDDPVEAEHALGPGHVRDAERASRHSRFRDADCDCSSRDSALRWAIGFFWWRAASKAPALKSDMADASASQQMWHPRHNPWLIAVAVMVATFMEVLDTSVANIALPHIAGNLSVTTEEATWVLTSYLVSNAIVLPMTGWLGIHFGRKNLLVICIVLFTFASVLCGMAPNLPFLIVARILQGVGGGAMEPIAQAMLLESFPPAKRGVAMAVVRHGRDRRADSGPDARRLDHGQLFLALDFLHQRAGGNCRGADGRGVHRRPALHQERKVERR